MRLNISQRKLLAETSRNTGLAALIIFGFCALVEQKVIAMVTAFIVFLLAILATVELLEEVGDA